VLEENARDDVEELRGVKPVKGDMFKEQPVNGKARQKSLCSC
jgi:hypothetical protein